MLRQTNLERYTQQYDVVRYRTIPKSKSKNRDIIVSNRYIATVIIPVMPTVIARIKKLGYKDLVVCTTKVV